MNVDRVRIRMYNVGFGDSFLVSFDHDHGTYRMLVDCGVHTGGGSGHSMDSIVDQIIADCGGDSARIDVVVATHRHRDHVSGFSNRKWATVDVGEVWLPFTENPDDVLGTEIKKAQSTKAKRLHAFLVRAGMGAAAKRVGDVVENSLTNAAAMTTLHRGFGGSPRRRYFPKPSGRRETFKLTGLDDATVHMLGPRRDETLIGHMDPPKDKDWLLQLARASEAGTMAERLFTADYVVDEETIRECYPSVGLTPRRLERLKRSTAVDLWAAAASVTDAVNNTSLFFAIEIGTTVLLFPGDAQWGLWDAILADSQTRDLLGSTTLYKVGHHGSHNATAKSFATGVLAPNATSLMSTHQVNDWPIPNEKLVTELKRGPRALARTDRRADGSAEHAMYIDHTVETAGV